MPLTRLYMDTKMATLTLQILCRAYETAHRRWNLRPDLLSRTWYQYCSPVRTTQPRWSLQTAALPGPMDWNEAVDPNHIPLPSIEELMELVAALKYWSKINLAHGYHNIRIQEDSEQHATFFTYMRYYHMHIMQQGDRNTLTTMGRAM